MGPKARLRGLKPEMNTALQVARDIFALYQRDCIVTSAVDGKHSRGSLHYVGYAVDLRRRVFTDPGQVDDVTAMLRESLTPEYDVVLEPSHWHIEFQPKRGLNL